MACARAHAADVEPTEIGLAEIEAIRDAHLVDAGAPAFFKREDIAAFSIRREDEAAMAKAPIFRAFEAGADIAYVAAQPGKILAEHAALPAGRAQAVVQAVKDQRIANRGGHAVADRVAQIAARLERIANGAGQAVVAIIGRL